MDPARHTVNKREQSGDRDKRGRFRPGCAPGPGNPHAGQVARIRAAVFKAATPERIREVIDAQIVIATSRKAGATAAAEFLMRYVFKAAELDLVERLERLEATMEQPRASGPRFSVEIES